jgi:AcrR family transcriptional regulator
MATDVTMLRMDEGTAAVGLRERKKERTRDAIYDAAMALFQAHGYAGTTVDDIADAADVSPRTFFRYYASKEEVLFARFDETLELLRDFLYSRPADETVSATLREASNQFASLGAAVSPDRMTFDLFHADEGLHGRYLQSFFHLETITSEWVASRLGVAPTELLPRLTGGALAAGARVALDVWADEPGRDLQELLEPPLQMIEGLLAEKG